MRKTSEQEVRAANLLAGDTRALVRQLGLMAESRELGLRVAVPALEIRDLPSLRAFLRRYQADVLEPVELPAISRAFFHACHYEIRELIALDQQFTAAGSLKEFAAASAAVGRAQLRRLLPLRDQRLVRRYLAAVERGEARGWHPLVYGVVMAVFALPQRQALLNYAAQTMQGFVESAAERLGLPEATRRDLADEATAPLPAAVERALGGNGSPKLLVVRR